MSDGMAEDIELARGLAAVQAIPGVPRLLELCLRATGMGFAAIARVTEDRWFACATLDRIGFGLGPGGELPVQTTICREVRSCREVIAFDDAAASGRWAAHPTPALYGLRSYISVPILLSDGSFWGTLCAIDPEPRPASDPDAVATFTLFAELLAFHVEAATQRHAADDALAREREEALLRERFVAVLGHDLRNPIAAIEAGARILMRGPLDEGSRAVVEQMRQAAWRMAGLVDDVLDFARGRMGGGIPLRLESEADLAGHVAQILAEHRAIRPERSLVADLSGLGPVRCDPRRVGQLLSNLVSNALAHGDAGQPVRVTARSDGEALVLAVENGGALPEEVRERLFEPFARAQGSTRGLGLGLYIAQEIARAHGGRIEALSDGGLVRFTVRLPGRARP